MTNGLELLTHASSQMDQSSVGSSAEGFKKYVTCKYICFSILLWALNLTEVESHNYTTEMLHNIQTLIKEFRGDNAILNVYILDYSFT